MKKSEKNIKDKKIIEKMTKEGKDLLYKELGKIEVELEELKKTRKEYAKREKAAVDAVEEKIERLKFRRNALLDRIANVEIIELKNMDGLHININDLIMLQMIFDIEDTEDMTLRLVAEPATIFDGKVSINSPLGQAMYGAEIGNTVSYSVNDKLIKVKLLKKVKEYNK